MKTILFLSTVFPRGYDKTRGIYCYHLCKSLSQRHRVHVISPRSWVEALTHRSPELPPDMKGVISHDYPIFFQPPFILRHRSDHFMWASIKRTVTRVIREIRPDCIISYWAHPDGAVAVRAAQNAGVPSGIIVGGSDILILPRKLKRKSAIVRTLTAASAVFAVSDDLLKKTIALGIDPAKVHVVKRGIDASFCPGSRDESRTRIGITTEDPVLLWVGRMDPVKGLDILLQACSELRQTNAAFQLYLVGNGPLRKRIAADIAQRELLNCVHLVGNVNHDQLPDWYRAANLTVLSSHSEGIPNVLRESLACGTPYVATQVGGVHELSDNPVNILVPPGNPRALADAIRKSMGRNEISIQEKFSTWDDYTKTILELTLRQSTVPPIDL